MSDPLAIMIELSSRVEQVAARDPGSTRLVYGIVIALLIGGAALAVFAWWLVRTTRPDPELLAPLEAIEGRRWRQLDPAGRRRLLDELRPEGAEPLDPARNEPLVDDEFRDDIDLRDVRELSDDAVDEHDGAGHSDGVVTSDAAPEADVTSGVVRGEAGFWAQLPPPSGNDWSDWDDRLGVERSVEEPGSPGR